MRYQKYLYVVVDSHITYVHTSVKNNLLLPFNASLCEIEYAIHVRKQPLFLFLEIAFV